MSVSGGIADTLGCAPDEMVVHAARRMVADRDRYRAALEEIDTYLANDPDVWRIVSVSKAGDVLCDVLGAETVQRINASVAANLCAKCASEIGLRSESGETPTP